MTTLEQNHAYNSHGSYPQEMESDIYIQASSAASNTVDADEHIDVQMFAPLPPHLLQAEGPSHSFDPPHGLSMQPPEQMASNDGLASWNDQMTMHGFSNFNYEDLFGDEDDWGRTMP